MKRAALLALTLISGTALADSVPGADPPPLPRGVVVVMPTIEISTRNPLPSNPNARGSARFDTLSALGIGLYSGFSRLPRSIVGDAFLFTDGLGRDEKHVGAAVGLAVAATANITGTHTRVGFQVGIALGVDLYRDEKLTFDDGVTREYRNGIVINNDVFGCGPNFGGAYSQNGFTCAARGYTWMLTLGVQFGAQK